MATAVASVERGGARPRRFTLGGMADGLSDLAIAALFVATWVAPGWLPVGMVRVLVIVMMVELVAVHQAGYLGYLTFGAHPVPTQRRRILVSILFGTTLVAAVSIPLGVWWAVFALWLLVLDKFPWVFPGDVSRAGRVFRAGERWAVCALSYLFYVGMILPAPIPPLGVTQSVLAAADLTGFWVSPVNVLCAGALHFASIGIYEIASHGSRWPGPDRPPKRGGRG